MLEQTHDNTCEKTPHPNSYSVSNVTIYTISFNWLIVESVQSSRTHILGLFRPQREKQAAFQEKPIELKVNRIEIAKYLSCKGKFGCHSRVHTQTRYTNSRQ